MDKTTTNAIVKLESFRLPYFYRKLSQLIAYFNNDIAIAINRKFGKLNWAFETHNLGTNVRLAVFSGLCFNTGAQTAFSYLEVGTSNTAVSAAHTALQAAITDSGLQRASATVTRVTTSQTNDTARMTKSFTVTGTKIVEELGYFNASSAGVMGGRVLTGTKSLVNGDTFAVTYNVQFT